MAKTKTCCVNGCKNKNIGADSGVIFYKFPEENALKRRWVEACLKNSAISDADQNWAPSNDTVICNVHFVSGQKNLNSWHPDYVPSVFRSLRKGPAKTKKKYFDVEPSVPRKPKRKETAFRRSSLVTPTRNTVKNRTLSSLSTSKKVITKTASIMGKPKKVVLLEESSLLDALNSDEKSSSEDTPVVIPDPTTVPKKRPLPSEDIKDWGSDKKLLKTLSVVLERTSEKDIKLTTGQVAIKNTIDSDYIALSPSKVLSSPKRKYTAAKRKLSCKKCNALEAKISKMEDHLMSVSSKDSCQRCFVLESKIQRMEEESEGNDPLPGKCQKCSITDQRSKRIEGTLKKSQAEVNKLLSKMNAVELNEETLKKYKNKVKLYTGLPNYETLQLIFDHVKPYLPNDTVKFLSSFQMLIIVLMKVRLNFPFWDLTYRFGASPNHIQSFYPQFISVLEQYISHVVLWPKGNLIYRLEVLVGNLKQNYNIIQKEIKINTLLVANKGQLTEEDKTIRVCAALYHISQLVSSNHSQQLIRILKSIDEADRSDLLNDKEVVDKDGNKLLTMTKLNIKDGDINGGDSFSDKPMMSELMNGDEFDQNVDDSDIFFEDLTSNTSSTGVNSNESLRLECRNLRKELKMMDQKLSVQFKFYTGMRNCEVFKNLLSFLQSHASHISTEKLTHFQQFHLVLIRLKLNLEVEDLGYMFNVDSDHIVYLTKLWIDIIVKRLSKYIDWPSGNDDLDTEKRLLGTVKLKYQILWDPNCAPRNKISGRERERFDSRQLLRACAALYNIDDIEVLKTGKKDASIDAKNIDLESASNEELENACKSLRDQAFEMRKCIMSRIASCFSEENLKENDEMVKFYTGFHSYDTLKNICDYIAPLDENESNNSKGKLLSPFSQFIMVLIRLKLNIPNQDVAFRFGMGASNAHKLIQDLIMLLHSHLAKHITWPDDDEDVEVFTNILRKTYAFIRLNSSSSRKDLRIVDSGLFDIATLVCAGLYNIGEVSYSEPSDSEFDSFDEEW